MKFLSFVRLFGEHWHRGASPSRRHSRKPRAAQPAKRGRLNVEALEDRTLMSVLPVTDVTGHFNSIAGSGGDHSSPAVAVDPLNPQHLVAIYTRNDPANLPAKTPIIIEAASSVDGGKNWNQIGLPGTMIDPSTSGSGIAPFPQETDGSVAFDTNHNFYLVYAEHQAGTANTGSGAIVEQKYNFSGGAPALSLANNVIYEWLHDPAFNPVVTVDNAPATFTDPTTGVTKTDPYAGTVYVSWSTNWVPPTGAQNFNANSIMVVSSSNGGQTFSAPVYINDNANFGSEHDAAPQITVSGGTTDGRVSPGQVNVVYDDFNGGSNFTPPVDLIRYNNIHNGGSSASFSGTTGPIGDAFHPTTGPDIAAVTDYTATVNITDPNFKAITKLDVAVNLTHPNLDQVEIELIRPDDPKNPLPEAQRTLVLVHNRIDGAGNSNTNIGMSGANMGSTPSGIPLDTIFDDDVPRAITTTSGAAAPFTGYYQPEDPLSFFNGLTPAQIKGTWTLRVIDTRNSGTPVQSVNEWRLIFNDGLTTTGSQIIATTPVRGSLVSPFPLQAAAAGNQGIGPSAVIASDNTLGSFSPYQGTIYIAYVDRIIGGKNPADNTDISLITSSDGGVSWGFPVKVNDDDAQTDGFSESFTGAIVTGRPQFMPALTVDQSTGTLVATWYDARNDPTRSSVARFIATSIDGGQTFSPNTYLNRSIAPFDEVSQSTVNVTPVLDDQAAGNANADKTFGFGYRESVVAINGQVYAVWSGNEGRGRDGKEKLKILSATAGIAAGPRVLSSTMGVASAPINTTQAPDGTLLADTFNVQFDRPVDPATFTPGLVTVQFLPTNGGLPVLLDIVSVTPLDPGAFGPASAPGATQFQVKFDPSKAFTQDGTYIGTYSYSIAPLVQDRIRHTQITLTTLATNNFSTASNLNLRIPPVGTGGSGDPAKDITLSTLNVAGIPPAQVITNVNVSLNLTHTFDSDLFIQLIAPDGTAVVLAANEGFNGHDYQGTTFSDQATTPIFAGFPPFTGSFRPETPLANLIDHNPNGTWTLSIDDEAAFDSGFLQNWSLSISSGTVATTVVPGNNMDQNADGTPGQGAYAAPRPINGTPFLGPYDSDTLPLIVPGPHIIGSGVPGTVQTADNLVLNGTVGSLDVVFDRNMNPSSFTPASVLRMIGPAGTIGPGANIPASFSITPNPNNNDPDPLHPRTFAINFLTLDGSKPLPFDLNGTYVLTLAPTITSAAGDALDSNENAGLDILRGTPTAGVSSVVYNSSGSTSIGGGKPGTITQSTINVPDSFLIPNDGITVQLNITYPHDPDLTVTLVAPNGQSVQLFTNIGANGSNQNFTNTVLDDKTSPVLAITGGAPPFTGRFNPEQPLSDLFPKGLAFNAQGKWTLQIKDSVAGTFGTLKSWSITLLKPVSTSGLGEPAADQAMTTFRIFTTNPTNPLSHSDWTSVGPAAVATGGGRIGGIAVDPSDPSGNTVYVGGASGGVWKTTDFLTTSPQGPTYLPLTDFGPTFGINIGGIGIFARNNDPAQSIIFAGTGEADTASEGVGFLRSLDGGASWTLLDSTANVDANGKLLPINSPLRDHVFVGMHTFKVLVDPRPTPSGQVIVYSAMTGPNGGIWRSVDSGGHWQLMRAGQATDIVFDPNSGHVNVISNPTGNLDFLYAAFQGDGVYSSPNRGTVWNQMLGGVGDPLIQDGDFFPNNPIPVTAPPSTPNGAFGRVLLAKPALTGVFLPDGTYTGNPAQDLLLEGWLYVGVMTASGHFQGLYLTKDFGQNWTKVHLGNVPSTTLGSVNAIPTNDPNQPDYDVGGAGGFAQGNYDFSLGIDPTNPNVVYIGGTADGQPTGFIRVDTFGLYDPHAFFFVSGTRPSPTTIKPANFPNQLGFFINPVDDPVLNLIRAPFDPFNGNGTILVSNTAGFTNIGFGATWIPFDLGGTDQHRIVTLPDRLTGHGRLIIGDDQGVFTGVDNNGILSSGIANEADPEGSASGPATRNGNLQVAQFYYGAAQPSDAAAQIAVVTGLFYSGVQDGAATVSAADVLTSGNLAWTNNGVGDSGGVATDQTGTGTLYQYIWPCCGGNKTDFFQVNNIGRTFGLIQASNPGVTPDPQWPYTGGANFAVNPIDGDQIIISSFAGRLFSTADQGRTWNVIGAPSSLDSSQSLAMAFGAPNPADPTGALNDFLYAGTQAGHVFVTFNGGGSNGNQWLNESEQGVDPITGFPMNAIDGSPVADIVTNPNRGSTEAYAVTSGGARGSFTQTPPPAVSGIPASGTASFGMTIPTDIYVGQLTVTLNVTHPHTDFLSVVLTAPDGEQFKLINVGDTSNANYTNTTLGDNPLLPSISSGAAPYTGNWRIADPNIFLSDRYNLANDFYGKSMRGTWGLTIKNTDSKDAGALTSWSLNYVSLGGVFHAPDIRTGAWFGASNGVFRIQAAAFGDRTNLVESTAAYLDTVKADWRYAIPVNPAEINNPASPPGPTYPFLYAGGEGGVYRSVDNGQTWTTFPDTVSDGATQNGGFLTNAHVTDLQLALGNINPTTGHPIVQDPTTGAQGPDVLYATTYGRGAFAIRVAPLIVPGSLQFDPKLPAPRGSGPEPNGAFNQLTPVIDGMSEQSAFDNTVKIELFDLTSGTPVPIGVDPNNSSQPFTFTDSNGRFKIEVQAGYFNADGSTDGPKVFGFQATDAAGAVGPMLTFGFTLDTTPFIHDGQVHNGILFGPAPHFDAAAPLPSSQGGSDSGLSIPVPGAQGTFTDKLTNVTQPIIDGVVDQAAPTQIQLIDDATGTPIGSAMTDANGNFSIQINPGVYKSDGTTDGTHTIDIVAPHIPQNSNTVKFTFTLDTTPPATPAAPSLVPSSDTGFSNSDHITSVTTPVFSGIGEPRAQVQLFANGNLVGFDSVTPSGNYTVTTNAPLADGTYNMTVKLVDLAGNASSTSTAMSPKLVIRTTPPSVPSLKLDPKYATSGKPNVTAAVPSLYDGTSDANSSVVIFDNGGQIDSFKEGSSGTFSRLENLTDGQHLLTVTATDLAGNSATFAPPNPDGKLGLEILVDRQSLDPSRKFIREIYSDALGRPGSLTEWNQWLALLGQPNGRFLVADAINRSQEARDFLVKGWYVNYLGRAPQNGEEMGWVNSMFQGHATEEQTLSGILATAEYFKHAATIVGGGATPSDTVFVKALYAQLFNRVPGSGEISNWVSQIPSIGRQGVAFDLLISLEYRRDVVLGYYITLLRRPTAPSQSEIDSWATSNMDITAIRVGFESSVEFYFRVTGFMP